MSDAAEITRLSFGRQASRRRAAIGGPRRWVVERSFAWIMKSHRLVRDYEQLTLIAEALILIAPAATMLRR